MDAPTTPPPPPRRVITVAVPAAGGDELSVPRALADRLRAVVESGYDVVLLDVSQLTHCNSMTLGAIVQTYVTAVKAGTAVKLLNVRRRFRDLLAVTKIDQVIEIVQGEFRDQAREVIDPEATHSNIPRERS